MDEGRFRKGDEHSRKREQFAGRSGLNEQDVFQEVPGVGGSMEGGGGARDEGGDSHRARLLSQTGKRQDTRGGWGAGVRIK